MRVFGRPHKKHITPTPNLAIQPVERLMFLAEQMQDLSTQVLEAADNVRQEIKKHGK